MPAPAFLLFVDAKFLSPYAMSAFVTLHEKGPPFDIQTLDLDARENNTGGLARTLMVRMDRPCMPG